MDFPRGAEYSNLVGNSWGVAPAQLDYDACTEQPNASLPSIAIERIGTTRRMTIFEVKPLFGCVQNF